MRYLTRLPPPPGGGLSVDYLWINWGTNYLGYQRPTQTAIHVLHRLRRTLALWWPCGQPLVGKPERIRSLAPSGGQEIRLRVNLSLYGPTVPTASITHHVLLKQPSFLLIFNTFQTCWQRGGGGSNIDIFAQNLKVFNGPLHLEGIYEGVWSYISVPIKVFCLHTQQQY